VKDPKDPNRPVEIMRERYRAFTLKNRTLTEDQIALLKLGFYDGAKAVAGLCISPFLFNANDAAIDPAVIGEWLMTVACDLGLVEKRAPPKPPVCRDRTAGKQP
jgi:hypothetical protein